MNAPGKWRRVETLREALAGSRDPVFYTTKAYDAETDRIFAEIRHNHPGLTDEELIQLLLSGPPSQ